MLRGARPWKSVWKALQWLKIHYEQAEHSSPLVGSCCPDDPGRSSYQMDGTAITSSACHHGRSRRTCPDDEQGSRVRAFWRATVGRTSECSTGYWRLYCGYRSIAPWRSGTSSWFPSRLCRVCRQFYRPHHSGTGNRLLVGARLVRVQRGRLSRDHRCNTCLLYTSDAAD